MNILVKHVVAVLLLALPSCPAATRDALTFEISQLKRGCNIDCVWLSQKLLNTGTSVFGVRIEAVAQMTSITMPATLSNGKGRGGSWTNASDLLPVPNGGFKCAVLKPGESFVMEVPLKIPSSMKNSPKLYVVQTYLNNETAACKGVAFFRGVVHSNKLLIVQPVRNPQ